MELMSYDPSEMSSLTGRLVLPPLPTDSGPVVPVLHVPPSPLPATPLALLFADVAVRLCHKDLWTKSTPDEMVSATARVYFDLLSFCKHGGRTLHFAMTTDAAAHLAVAGAAELESCEFTLKLALESAPDRTLNAFKVLVWATPDEANRSLARPAGGGLALALAGRALLFLGLVLCLVVVYGELGCSGRWAEATGGLEGWVRPEVCGRFLEEVELPLVPGATVNLAKAAGTGAAACVGLFYCFKAIGRIAKTNELKAGRNYVEAFVEAREAAGAAGGGGKKRKRGGGEGV
jgi:hypothetical protein